VPLGVVAADGTAALSATAAAGTGAVGRGNSTGVISTTPPVSRIARKNRLSITAGGIRRCGLGHGIETARPEGMAARDPLHREPAATQGTVLLERLDGVVRTRRMIPTRRRQQRREHDLVRADEKDEDVLHATSRNAAILVPSVTTSRCSAS